MRKTLLVLAKGFCMGTADVVPGVSGGTMAFILGIYQRLLEAVRAFDLRLLSLLWHGNFRGAVRHSDLEFLLPLALGIFGALMFFTRVVPLPSLIQTHPQLIYGLFFGLILASILVLLQEVGRIGWDGTLVLTVGTGIGLLIVNLVPMETPETSLFVFLSGAVAITAMILPGISGSFILLILRKYAYVLDAVGRLDLVILLPFALGAIAGLLLFTRLLVWLLHRFYRMTLILITGILIGSLWMVWPFQERVFETVRGKQRLLHATPIWPGHWAGTDWVALGLVAVGLALVLAIHGMARSRPHPG
jgi:putative membrane protein